MDAVTKSGLKHSSIEVFVDEKYYEEAQKHVSEKGIANFKMDKRKYYY